jgi:nitrogen fixation protein NifU and related proteins
MSLPYGATVLDHFRRPRNQRSLERPTLVREGFNALCGDRVRIEVEVRASRLEDVAFTANACAICTAAASLLTERVRGLSIDDATDVSEASAIAALGTDVPAGRRMCAVLPLRTLREALAELPRSA